LKLLTPNGDIDFTPETLLDDRGAVIDVAPGSGYKVSVALGEKLALDEHGGMARYL